MFAFNKHSFAIAAPLAVVVICCFVTAQSLCAQQPEQPSQRYQPIRKAPPTVHVPSTTPSTAKATSTSAANNFPARQVSFSEQDDNQTTVPKLLQASGPSLIDKQETLSRVNQSAPQLPSEKTPPSQLGTPLTASDSKKVDNGFAPRPNASGTQPKVISLSNTNKETNGQTTKLPITSANTFKQPTPSANTPLSELGHSGQAMVELSTPAISVKSFGPSTIGINKPSSFRVQVSNNGTATAKNLMVGIHLPQWVDVEQLQASTGLFKTTDGIEQARVVWTIDRIAGNATHWISIPAIPRKAELFDMEVEWTFIPITGKSSVAVTQPKLEMTISGPDDILYGDKAVYQVEIRNPGTGTAEEVVVKLPEALGGESQPIGNITPGKSQRFQIELFARTAGELNLLATATANGELTSSVQRKVRVRRANLEVTLNGPAKKYAGTDATYNVTVTNRGDAIAEDVMAAIALPNGVEYLGGLDNAEQTGNGLTWNVGSMKPGDTEEYNIRFVLNTSGDVQLEVGTRGAGDLAAANQCVTTVQTVADLTLNVVDPRGPLPTGETVAYEIRIKNRGSKAATNIDVVMHFADGIEPTAAEGMKNQISPGEVAFNAIPAIQPGQEIVLTVMAEAEQSGTHVFRAQLTCDDSESSEIAQGTTRFYGDTVRAQAKSLQDNRTANERENSRQNRK